MRIKSFLFFQILLFSISTFAVSLRKTKEEQCCLRDYLKNDGANGCPDLNIEPTQCTQIAESFLKRSKEAHQEWFWETTGLQLFLILLVVFAFLSLAIYKMKRNKR